MNPNKPDKYWDSDYTNPESFRDPFTTNPRTSWNRKVMRDIWCMTHHKLESKKEYCFA